MYFVFHISLFTTLTVMATIIVTLLFIPITQLITIALSTIIVNILILFQINAMHLKNESPALSAIKNTITISITELERLIEASTQLCNSIFIIKDTDQDESKEITNQNPLYDKHPSFFFDLNLPEKRCLSVPSLLCNKEIQTTTKRLQTVM